MKRLTVAVVIPLALTACDPESATEPLTPASPDRVIADAAHGGQVDGFYFLPPMVKAPSTSGAFNPLVAPRIVICRVDTSASPVDCGTAAADTVAVYTMTGGTDGSTISLSTADEHYRVNWNTRNFSLDTDAAYRIKVFLTVHAGALQLGVADVKLGANRGELRNLDSDTIIPLVDSRTLPIKFRIEHGAGCAGAADCGSGTVGPAGGIVTTASGDAGVSVPAGAVDNPITISIRQLDAAQQPGGVCLPTGIRQDGACYEFDTEQEISTVQDDGSNTFHEPVTVGLCQRPNAVRPQRLTLHKYDPERSDQGVVELPSAAATFLRCDELAGPEFASTGQDGSLFGRLAEATRRVLSPLAAAIVPAELHARDIGLGGLTDSFSRINWGESIILASSPLPGSATPGADLTATVSATTNHNHSLAPTAGTDAQLRLQYTDPEGTTVVWYDTTDAQGQVPISLTLSEVAGVHTLSMTSRDTDPSLQDALVDDPTVPVTLHVVACANGLDCGLGTVDSNGGTVTSANGAAGVSVPAGAVLEPVTIVIQQLDPAAQPGGTCLPTGIRQDGACYDFDTVEEISDVTGGSDTFLSDVTAGVCPSPNAVREERLTLHKYNPQRPGEGVLELPTAPAPFLDCSNLSGPGYAVAPSGFFGRLARMAGDALTPVLALVAPAELHARDAGLGGLTDSFSRMSWAESITLSASGLPSTAAPSDVLAGTVSATTAHNHALAPTAGTDAWLRFDYTDPVGVAQVWYDSTNAAGEIVLAWPLSQATGTHTLIISSRDLDPSLQGTPLIDDPTPLHTLTVDAVPGGATITGFVTDAPSAQPVGGATVSVASTDSVFSVTTTTGADGSYSQEVPAGTHIVSASAEGYQAADSQSVTVGAGQTLSHDMLLTAVLFGEVITPGAAGNPRGTIAGMDVLVEPCESSTNDGGYITCDDTGSSFNARTDTDGRFRVASGVGLWKVTPDPSTAGYLATHPTAALVSAPLIDPKGGGTQFVALIPDQEQPVIAASVNIGIGGSEVNQRIAQTFTVGIQEAWITQIQVPVQCSPVAGDDLTVEIHGVDDNGHPDEVSLTTTVIDGDHLAAFSEPPEFRTLLLADPVQLSAGTQYALVLSVPSPGDCTLRGRGPEGDPYTGGNGFHFSAPNNAWVPFAEHDPWADIPFRILVQ